MATKKVINQLIYKYDKWSYDNIIIWLW
jgi:hypothetical protein